MNFFRRLVTITLLLALVLPTNSYAIYDGIREVTGYENESCQFPDSEFAKPMEITNRDFDFDLSNNTCMSYMLGFGIPFIASYKTTSAISCNPSAGIVAYMLGSKGQSEIASKTSNIAIVSPSVFIKAGSVISAFCATMAAEATKMASSCALPVPPPECALAPLAATQTSACCANAVVTAGIMASAIGAMMTIWGVADQAFYSTRICGHDWYEWYQDKDQDGAYIPNSWTNAPGVYQKCLKELFVYGGNFDIDGQSAVESDLEWRPTPDRCKSELYKKGNVMQELGGLVLDQLGSSGSWIDQAKKRDITNQFYREFLYGGKEYKDNHCENPNFDIEGKKKEILGYDDTYQRYYLRGANASSNYACERFIMGDEKDRDAAAAAYQCCKKRARNTICIEGRRERLAGYESKFCEEGSKCNVAFVDYEIYPSKKSSGYICAKTYSVCPYNHLVGGGTEEEEMLPANATKRKNFCQYRKHCVRRAYVAEIYDLNYGDNAFIDSACYDLRGDSQNVLSYEADLLPIRGRNFSAPIAQCIKGTMENFVTNKSADGRELSTPSVLAKIQDTLQDAIRIAMILSVVFFGGAILIGAPAKNLDRKTLMIYILKLGLVFYFATGDGWQDGFSKGVLDISTLLSELTFRPIDDNRGFKTPNSEGVMEEFTIAQEKLDGCQFPRLKKGKNPDELSYPEGLGYLRIFDTLDCKIVRALGYGVEANVPNLVLMILAGFFTGGLAIIFLIATMFFALFLIALTIKALHIFLMSTISITLLIFISPITITCALFGKTKNIFQGWMKQLMGFCLQPMILFAYLGIMITAFDQVIIGQDVTFSGEAENGKAIICNDRAKQTSIYCIFNIADLGQGNQSDLQKLGIVVPVLNGMDAAKLSTIVKAAIIMFIFSKFMDQISTFATSLVGGANLGTGVWNASAMGMAGKSYKVMKAIQDRGRRAGLKVARKGFSTAGKTAGRIGDKATNKGKEIKRPKALGGDNAANEAPGSSSAQPKKSMTSRAKSAMSKAKNRLTPHSGKIAKLDNKKGGKSPGVGGDNASNDK